jgi:glycosyltransferase involved in cell wall biosynthesis
VAFDDDGRGIESHSLVNARWSRELQARGHAVVALDDPTTPRPDVVINHNYLKHFLGAPRVPGARHVAVRTSDFGPFPASWVEVINRHYDHLWVHSRWIAEQALVSRVDPARLRVVHHGVDPLVYRPDGPRRALPTRKAFPLLFVGGAVRRKGVDILLRAYAEAFRRDDDVCLVIKDHGANAFYHEGTEREAIRRLAEDPAAPELVYIDRHLTAPELAALYRACRVAVFPYRAEGFAIPPLEALACGVPTILPRFGACLDFSDDTTSFLMPVKRINLPVRRVFRSHAGFDWDIGAVDFCEVPVGVLAATLRQAYEADPEVLAAKAAAGVTRVLGQFTWRHAGDRVERHLRELTDGA